MKKFWKKFAAVPLVLLGLVCFTAFLFQFFQIASPYQTDYGEAPIAQHAIRFARGENLYPYDLSAPPYLVTNYPPIYLWIVGLGRWLFPDLSLYAFGRLISVISSWIGAYVIAQIVMEISKDKYASYFAAGMYLTMPIILFWSGIMRVDMLSTAFGLLGILLALRHPTESRFLFASGALMVLAIYTRQTALLAAPVSIGIFLGRKNIKTGMKYLAAVFGASVGLFLVGNWITNGGFFVNLVTSNQNSYSLDRTIAYFFVYFRMAFFLIISFASIFFYTNRSRLILIWLLPYSGLTLLAALTVGKVGSAGNYFIELSNALVIGFGVSLWRIRLIEYRNILIKPALGITLIMLIIVQVSFQAQFFVNSIAHIKTEQRILGYIGQNANKASEKSYVSDTTMGALIASGQDIYFQPFEFSQMAIDGTWDQANFIKDIQAKKFSGFFMDVNGAEIGNWTPEMVNAIQQNYQVEQKFGDATLFTPKK